MRGEIKQLAVAAAQVCIDVKREFRRGNGGTFEEFDALAISLQEPALRALEMIERELEKAKRAERAERAESAA